MSGTRVEHVGAALRALLGADTVAHRPNHTGAGKLSFAVVRRSERLWVRVAADDDEHAALLRWAAHASVLSDRYAAPPVLDLLEVEGRATLVFPHLAEPVATRADLRAREDEVREALARLHADVALAGALGPAVPARDSFDDVWLRRLRADLEIVAGYVPPDVHQWMTDEAEALAGDVAGPAFDEQVHAPIHGDPWHENLLVGPDRWWLIDWEDLAVGDPVVDEAIVHFDCHGPGPERWPGTARHRVARRALMLDAVVDVAADWVENHDPVVKQAKQAAYLAAVETYRAEWA